MKNNSKTLGMAIFMAIITLTSTFNLCAETDTNQISVKATSGVFNKYLAFASGIIVYDKPEVETDILITHKKTGIYFDLWYGTGLNGNMNDQNSLNDEIDLNLGCSRPIGKGYAFDVGVSYFNEPSLSTLGKGDIWWTYLQIDKSFKIGGHDFTGFVKANSYTPNKGSGFRGGKVFDLGINTSVDFSEKVSLFTKTGIAYVTEGFGKKSGMTWKTFGALNWKISQRISLCIPQATFYVPLGWNEMRNDIVFGGSLSITL